MSRKELLLKQLRSDFGDVSSSLLYRAIELSSNIVINGGKVSIYVTGSGYLGRFAKPVLTIELANGRVVVQLPKYCSQPIYICTIDPAYGSSCDPQGNHSIKLIDVFRIIYRSAISHLSRGSCVSHLESLLLAGTAVAKDDSVVTSSTCAGLRHDAHMIKVYHKCCVYFDNAYRCSAFFGILIDRILSNSCSYNVIDILDCFGGVITDEDIDDRLKPSILYLRNGNISDVSQLKKFTSLKFVDLGSPSGRYGVVDQDHELDCQTLLDMGYQSIRLNDNQIIGVDPILDFLALP